ncbi:uncharacterized protein BJ171DRAFT_581470 [Polychytrium aggregatum]|uniref:uncharacterized protein n=1 Tax=Polychytrium aggregatum TaxID=110093 RepID=UPI0022FE34B8|nr:uncharacterized protein BJ171DRAFT_581470 [Polychytrium aggregatum]KAI9204784.1 hypothetical protein BJ171DRAFT_581470 [Polychytrium aggregatum]
MSLVHRGKVILAAWAALVLVVPMCLAWQLDVVFYQDDNYGGASFDFQIHNSLECYNIDQCFNDQMSSYKVTSSCDIPAGMKFNLYADVKCPWNDWSNDCRLDGSSTYSSYVDLIPCQTVSVPSVGLCLNDKASAFMALEQWQSSFWWNAAQYTFSC